LYMMLHVRVGQTDSHSSMPNCLIFVPYSETIRDYHQCCTAYEHYHGIPYNLESHRFCPTSPPQGQVIGLLDFHLHHSVPTNDGRWQDIESLLRVDWRVPLGLKFLAKSVLSAWNRGTRIMSRHNGPCLVFVCILAQTPCILSPDRYLHLYHGMVAIFMFSEKRKMRWPPNYSRISRNSIRVSKAPPVTCRCVLS
jgi:hypothetical protein